MPEQIDDASGGAAEKAMVDPRETAAELRREIVERFGETWLHTEHALLGGLSPDQAIKAGDIKMVRNLLDLILYVGIS
jgi:hypothetical protein